jgi:hypothetical protein
MSQTTEETEHAFTVTTKVDYNDILNLIINAFDTAIGYWCRDADPHYPEGFDVKKIPWLKRKVEWKYTRKLYFCPLVPGGRLEMHDTVEDKTVYMDLESVQRGIDVMSKKYPQHWSDFLSQNDDAITADVFIQCCVFGEAIYG